MDIILKAVLNKVAVWKQMYANHEATADEINDRNWHGMCVVLTDRISELEAQLVEIPSPADLYSEIESLQKQLEAVRLLPDMFDSKFHHQHIGTDAYKQGAKEAYGTAAYELRAAIGEVES